MGKSIRFYSWESLVQCLYSPETDNKSGYPCPSAGGKRGESSWDEWGRPKHWWESEHLMSSSIHLRAAFLLTGLEMNWYTPDRCKSSLKFILTLKRKLKATWKKEPAPSLQNISHNIKNMQWNYFKIHLLLAYLNFNLKQCQKLSILSR